MDEKQEVVQGSNIVLNVVCEKDIYKIRQDFVDVNKNAKQTTPSINTLFNTRDAVPNIVSIVMDHMNYLEELVDIISTSISKKCSKIYTLNNIKNVVVELAGYNAQSGKGAEEKANKQLKDDEMKKKEVLSQTILFFDALKVNEFVSECIKNKHKIKDIRQTSVLTVGIGLSLVSYIAKYIFEHFDEEEWKQQLLRLVQYDWSRRNPLFLETGIVGKEGAIANTRAIITKTKAALLGSLGYEYKKDEEIGYNELVCMQ